MAYSSIPTQLSLDECAFFLGLNPAHFNQATGVAFPFCGADCQDLWCEATWHSSQGLARESLAREIARAEREVSRYLGQPLTPTPVTRVVPLPADADVNLGVTVHVGPHLPDYAPYRYVALGDVSWLDGGMVRTDADEDNFDEAATVSLALPAAVDPAAVVAYVAGQGGMPVGRVRPLRDVTVTYREDEDDYLLSFAVPVWQLVDRKWLVRPPISGCDCGVVDLDGEGALVAGLEVGYMAPDHSRPQVRFLYDDAPITCGVCTACTDQYVDGIAESLGDGLRLRAAVYDEETARWTAAGYACGCCRCPTSAQITYYTSYSPPTPTGELDLPLKQIVALLAGARLQVSDCACECGAGVWFRSLQADLAVAAPPGRYVTQDRMNAFFGTRRGEQLAYSSLLGLTGGKPVVKHGSA